MTTYSCRGGINFTGQTVIEGAVLFTKTIKSLVSTGHPLTLPLT